MQRAVSTVLLSSLLVGMIILGSRIQDVKASERILIFPEGGIHPPTANITTTDAIHYIFTDNNFGSIAVYRNNIVIDGAGYTLQGAGTSWPNGIELTNRTNVKMFNKGMILR